MPLDDLIIIHVYCCIAQVVLPLTPRASKLPKEFNVPMSKYLWQTLKAEDLPLNLYYLILTFNNLLLSIGCFGIINDITNCHQHLQFQNPIQSGHHLHKPTLSLTLFFFLQSIRKPVDNQGFAFDFPLFQNVTCTDIIKYLLFRNQYDVG